MAKLTYSKRHPYASIDHRVIDSPAYADLSFSACALLLLLARQLNKNNNGHLQATFTFCKKRGFGSEHTLQAAIAALIAHGFIYRTRSHGANKAWAKYAVTWLSITDKKDLFCAGFKLFAWRDWVPDDKRSSLEKMQDESSQKCSFTPANPAQSAGTAPAESAGYEVMPCRGVALACEPIHSPDRKAPPDGEASIISLTSDRSKRRAIASASAA